MSVFSAIDLSLLPSPDVVETLAYADILAALRADMLARAPELTEALALESEPVNKLLEVCAYRETILRARVNDAARAVMLAYATGGDLDQLGAWWGVTRRIVDPGDPSAVPPTVATYETDVSFRASIQESLEAHTTAGSIGAYHWHALRADPALRDVGISSPLPGTVLVSVLAETGTPTPGQLAAVVAALNDESVRPLCDTVIVEAAELLDYAVTATLHLASGPDPAAVQAAAESAVTAYGMAQRLCGARVAVSALLAALHQPGVAWVGLASPAADVVALPTQAPWLGTVTVTTIVDDNT